MKYFVAIFLFAVCSLAYVNCDSPKTHLFGVIGPNDRLLHRQAFKRESTFLRKTVLDFTYPPPGVALNFVITAISVTDQHDSNGEVKITAGGVNQRSATIHLKSARNHGMDFIVEIWGRM